MVVLSQQVIRDPKQSIYIETIKEIYMFSPDGQFLNFSTNPGSEFLSSGWQCLRKLPELRIAHLYRFIIPTASYLFSMRPKFHMIWHAVQRMKRTRIRANVFWTFCGEDAIGAAATMCSRLHPATISKRALQRWLLQFASNCENDQV